MRVAEVCLRLNRKVGRGTVKLLTLGSDKLFPLFLLRGYTVRGAFLLICIGLRGSSGSPLEMEITGFLFRLFDLTFRDRSLTTAALSVCLSISSLDYVS